MLMISCFPGNQQVETDSGSLIPEVNGILQYRIAKDAIGKFISFQCTPERDDGIVGEPRTCMSQERVRPGNFVLLCHNICCGDYCLCLFLLSGKQIRCTLISCWFQLNVCKCHIIFVVEMYKL